MVTTARTIWIQRQIFAGITCVQIVSLTSRGKYTGEAYQQQIPIRWIEKFKENPEQDAAIVHIATTTEDSNLLFCWMCGQKGHTSRNCTNYVFSARKKDANCGSHTVPKCTLMFQDFLKRDVKSHWTICEQMLRKPTAYRSGMRMSTYTLQWLNSNNVLDSLRMLVRIQNHQLFRW